MSKRFVSIWFRYLLTDWFTIRQPLLRGLPFVLAKPDHGRMIVTAANSLAQAEGAGIGMTVADARAIIPSLQVLDDRPGLAEKLLKGLAIWSIRYAPVAAMDAPDGIILDASGCAHLWGNEKAYLEDMVSRLKGLGYHIHAAMADTIGAAWAISHYGPDTVPVEPGGQTAVLLPLPPAALRLEVETIERLQKLGLRRIGDFIGMPRHSLLRRFGQPFIHRLDQALGYLEEMIIPVQPVVPYQERLPCLEPIVTATGIEIALKELLKTLCFRLRREAKGLRVAVFKGFRVDGRIETIEIGTNRASHNTRHLFKLFEHKLSSIEPAMGIELFILEAPRVDEAMPVQEKIWEGACGLGHSGLSELIDRLGGKLGADRIHRYIPDQHYWPERAIKKSVSLQEIAGTAWRTDRPRPMQLLAKPERIEVTAPIPDYPPMLFRYRGKLHKIVKADGPERIEQEWWLQQGLHRDYYCVEDEEGQRYWLFRSGHYTADRSHQWFIHGFFA